MADLLTPISLRSVTLRNRIVLSPMCQYSAKDGFADDWHLVHLGARAQGGAALILTEATSVSPEGRISPADLGLWKDEQIEAFQRIARFVTAQGAVIGMQLAHAGRKACTAAPWLGRVPLTPENGGWRPIYAPSAIPFDADSIVPEALDVAGIQRIIGQFQAAARRALTAGMKVLELHAAHGYLAHQFLSPISNQRSDQYGSSFENRTRFVREMVEAVRKVWPDELPLLVRISATDWVPNGWDVEQSVELARQLKALGVDLIDCSSGGNVVNAQIPVGPGYQVPFARQIRETGILAGAVGLITSPQQADQIIRCGDADVVLLAREFLRQPYWGLLAGHALGRDVEWPKQYERAKRF